MTLDSYEIFGGGREIAILVVSTITSYSETNSFCFYFLGSDCDYYSIKLSIKEIVFVSCG